MATVTGLTAARMLAIEGASVIDGEVVGDNLVLTKHNGTTINAGNVRGPKGDTGDPGADGEPITAGDQLVVWNGSGWVYQGTVITVRPTLPTYAQGSRVIWDTSIYPLITTFPTLAIAGDGWRPHGDVAIALLGGA